MTAPYTYRLRHYGKDAYEFLYREGKRLPAAIQSANGAIALLFYDQVGSLRVVADQSGNMIKETLYDPFGGILEDTNPALRIPIGFAGGLHDRDLGLVRFGWPEKSAGQRIWTLRSSATPRRGEGHGRPESL